MSNKTCPLPSDSAAVSYASFVIIDITARHSRLCTVRHSHLYTARQFAQHLSLISRSGEYHSLQVMYKSSNHTVEFHIRLCGNTAANWNSWGSESQTSPSCRVWFSRVKVFIEVVGFPLFSSFVFIRVRSFITSSFLKSAYWAFAQLSQCTIHFNAPWCKDSETCSPSSCFWFHLLTDTKSVCVLVSVVRQERWKLGLLASGNKDNTFSQVSS